MQAEIAACHARAASVKDADWKRIAALYVVLAHLIPSPVVELNRAVAVGMAYGPARGLEIADTLTSEPVLAGYAQLPAVRGDLLAKLGRRDEARVEFTRAAALTGNERETGHLPGASLSLPRRTGVIMTSRNGAAPSAPAHQRGRRLHLI